MKIKISKSQWEGIGKKAGWIKEAEGRRCPKCNCVMNKHPDSEKAKKGYKNCPKCNTTYSPEAQTKYEGSWAYEQEQKHKQTTASQTLPPNTQFYKQEPGDTGKVPKVEGYYLIKQHQKWGFCPTYRKIDGNKEDTLFYDQQTNQLLNWNEMKDLLKREWRPASREEQDWFVAYLGD